MYSKEYDKCLTQSKRAFINWLAHGERGVSSNAIASVLSGIDCLKNYKFSTNPSDPADFLRCQKLFTQVPEFRPQLQMMYGESPEWASLVDHWQEIEDVIAQDLIETDGKRAPKGYELMRKVIDSANWNSYSERFSMPAAVCTFQGV